MKKPTQYNLTPAKGQALLNFQGRIFPKSIELFETDLIEEVRQKVKQDKVVPQNQLNSDFRNLIIHGDCLSACAYLKSKDTKVDLVYIDPPFASGANYAKTIFLRSGKQESVDNDEAVIGEEIMYGDIWQKEDYLNWLYERLLAIRDVMSEKASIYVHLDWHIGHYAKLLLDEIFGEENFQNEIIWYYWNGGGRSRDSFNRKHDTIFWYSKGDGHTYNGKDAGEKRNADLGSFGGYFKKDAEGRLYQEVRANGKIYKYYVDELKNADDVWVLGIISQRDETERRYYVTQKPEELVERIIKASSDEGMIVGDFFVGSGTAAKVANDLNRRFIGVDVGMNAIQTTRDCLIKAGAEFDILKAKDGVRLFRNPTQTTAKIFSLIDGFKTKADLGLGEFWDGGIVDDKGEYIPVKFIPIHDRLTKPLLDILLEEIYQLQDVAGAVNKVKVIYAHKDDEINQSYINKAIKEAGKTTVEVELTSLDELLGEKADKLFMPDSAEVVVTDSGSGSRIEIKRFFSPYLRAKVDEYNSKKVRNVQTSVDDGAEDKPLPKKKVSISESGLELIEAVQFDTTLRKDGVWVSDTELEDKAGVKDKIKAVYQLPVKRFKMKIRNIAGDEIVIGSEKLQKI
jgi:adenine-specific DNA-methyltransferase